VVFLERDIKSRKQAFGIEVYDILSQSSGGDSSAEIQRAFEQCQSDIQHLEAKVTSKRREMDAIDRSSAGGGRGPGNVVDDAETPGIPTTP